MSPVDYEPIVHAVIDFGQINVTSMEVPPVPVRVLTNGYSSLLSSQSRLLTSDRDYNEVKPGDVHKYPGVYFTAGESLAKKSSDDGCATKLPPQVEFLTSK